LTFLKTNRTKQSFEDRLEKKAPGTRELYKIAFRNFEKFCNEHYSRSSEEVFIELTVVEEQAVYDTIQDWIDWNVTQQKGASTIRMWFSCINNYLRYKGIKIEAKENIDFPKKIEEELYPLQLEDIHSVVIVQLQNIVFCESLKLEPIKIVIIILEIAIHDKKSNQLHSFIGYRIYHKLE